jgi:GST-like protein
MTDLYYWPTPNGHKIVIFLEETGFEYKIIPVNIDRGDQFYTKFLRISPNNKIPAIVDHSPKGDIALFESGAILEYLADKRDMFLPAQYSAERYAVLKWLYWQVAGLGPMAGQNHHFSHYAPERIPYAVKRYQDETHRLYRVLNKQLFQNPYVAGKEYSIADMAVYPWIVPDERPGIDLNEFQSVKRWFEEIQQRPAVVRAYKKGEEINPQPAMTGEARQVLFGQR